MNIYDVKKVIPVYYLKEYPNFFRLFHELARYKNEARNVKVNSCHLDWMLNNYQNIALFNRLQESFTTSTEQGFRSQDGFIFRASYLDKDLLKEQLISKGVKQNNTGIKDLTLLRLLPYLDNLKGTTAVLELLFKTAFNENIVLNFPKDRLAILDDNFVLDGETTLRDDILNQEYSISIGVVGDSEKYQGLIGFYQERYHPGGFFMHVYQQE